MISFFTTCQTKFSHQSITSGLDELQTDNTLNDGKTGLSLQLFPGIVHGVHCTLVFF